MPAPYSNLPPVSVANFQALVHVGRANRSGQLQRSTYQDEIPKTADKMMALMTIATSLAPGAKVDDQVRYLLARAVDRGRKGTMPCHTMPCRMSVSMQMCIGASYLNIDEELLCVVVRKMVWTSEKTRGNLALRQE